MKLEVCARPREESTMVEIIKYPCGHVCMAAPRNWWRILKCAECGGKWSMDEGEVELESLTTILHHVRLRIENREKYRLNIGSKLNNVNSCLHEN